MKSYVTLLATTIWLCAGIKADPVSSLNSLYEEYFQWRLRDDPELASYLNVHDYDDKVGRVGFGEFDAIKAKVDYFLDKLKKIDTSSLPRDARYNMVVFENTLRTVSDGYSWRLYGAINPISFLGGIQMNPGSFNSYNKFDSKKGYENFVSRLKGIPQQIKDTLAMLTEAVQLDRTNNIHSMKHVQQQFADFVKSDPTDLVYYKPLKADLDNLTISEAEKSQLREEGKQACKDILDVLIKLRDFIANVYMHHTRGSFGVGGLNRGVLYYIQCLKWHLSTDLDPARVHGIGLEEVARISAEMKKVMLRLNFTGTIPEFFAVKSKEPRFRFKSAEDILNRYRDVINNRVYPALPKLFKNIPPQRVKVTKMKNDGPGAEYQPGSADGVHKGEIMVNTFRPNETTIFDVVSTSLHEGVPGHHFQFINTETADLPKYMKDDTSGGLVAAPFSFPGFTSYVEGWALYAESLGEELGVYRDDYELMGRYSMEIFRACRLVVDTGLHVMGWSRDRAIKYMQQYTSVTGGELINEIDRYITWPGQACAYKIGEMKIRQLRKKAEKDLGANFDIRDFHDVVLRHGTVPLTLLETIVDDWITDVKTSGHVTSDSKQSNELPVYTFAGKLPIVPPVG